MNVAYVAIVSRDFGCVESAFERQLGLVRATVEFKGSPVAAYQVGETKIIVLPPDSPALPGPAKTNVHHLAIESADPLADAKASGLWHRPTETHASFDGGTRVFAPSTATSGVMLCYTTPLKVCDPVTAITQRIDHLGIVTDSRSAAQEEFCGGGLPLESFQQDVEAELPLETFTSSKYGVVYHSRPPRPKAGVHSVFATIGDFELEFLEAFDLTGAGPRTAWKVQAIRARTVMPSPASSPRAGQASPTLP